MASNSLQDLDESIRAFSEAIESEQLSPMESSLMQVARAQLDLLSKKESICLLF